MINNKKYKLNNYFKYLFYFHAIILFASKIRRIIPKKRFSLQKTTALYLYNIQSENPFKKKGMLHNHHRNFIDNIYILFIDVLKLFN